MACFHPVNLEIWLGGKTKIIGGTYEDYKDLKILEKAGRRFVRVRCGSCIGCRLDQALEWTTKASIQMQLQPDNAYFVTLTYDDAFLPVDHVVDPRDFQVKDLPVLRRSHVQDFLKLLRYKLDNIGAPKIKIMYCGEYGPTTQRCHYHFLIWNLELPDLRRPTLEESKGKQIPYRILTSDFIRDTWQKGFISVEKMDAANVAYVCRYTLKKQLGAEKADYLEKCTEAEILDCVDKITGEVAPVTGKNIRPFEFLGYSNRPGIGMIALQNDEVVERMLDEGSLSIVLGGKVMTRPIPRSWLTHLEDRYPERVAKIRSEQLRRAEQKAELMLQETDRKLEEILRCQEVEKIEKLAKYDREL